MRFSIALAHRGPTELLQELNDDKQQLARQENKARIGSEVQQEECLDHFAEARRRMCMEMWLPT